MKERGSGIIVAGFNYGQGSSREHAALAPKYLNVKAILARSFARIHVQNLCNFGILPLTFVNAADYNTIDRDDMLLIENVVQGVRENRFIVVNKAKGHTYEMVHPLTDVQKEIIIAGGLLRYAKKRS
jgi:aconitate hydratase